MRLHYFQHVPYEGLDRIESWAKTRGHAVSVTRVYADDPFPTLADVDLILIMGGPMGVYEVDQYPWMRGELTFIRKAIDARKKVLGICLGAQLIASALGARVYPQREKEIGWWPVQFSPYPVEGTPLAVFGAEAMLYHWHGDTFDLPSGTVRLASSRSCTNQAYAIGQDVLALQFHPEIRAETIDHWIKESDGIKNPGRFVMSDADMKRLAPAYQAALEGPLNAMLDRFSAASR